MHILNASLGFFFPRLRFFLTQQARFICFLLFSISIECSAVGVLVSWLLLQGGLESALLQEGQEGEKGGLECETRE